MEPRRLDRLCPPADMDVAGTVSETGYASGGLDFIPRIETKVNDLTFFKNCREIEHRERITSS
jgi:hypothetical protein